MPSARNSPKIAFATNYMKPETREQVKNEVMRFVRSIPGIDRAGLDLVKRQYPFHAVIFSGEAILYAKQERSVVTKMGLRLFPNLARLVARDSYTDVDLDHDIRATIDAGSLRQIDAIVNDLRAPGHSRIPNHKREMEEILTAASGTSTTTAIRADLYVGDYAGGPLFMEIKSPMPNLDICAESKKKFLIFEATTRAEGGRAYFGFAYNPYLTRDAYSHSFTKAIMDMDEEVLMGSEMWDKLGGPGTYDEVLGILAEAAKEVRPAD